MPVTDELVRSVVQEVLGAVRNVGLADGVAGAESAKPRHATVRGFADSAPATQRRTDWKAILPSAWGVFSDVSAAVAAAAAAQRTFERRGLEDRRKAVACIRRIC